MKKNAPSFKKISDNEYEIFGLPYKADQIIEMSTDGLRTLDGNTEYYMTPEFRFPKKEDTETIVETTFHILNYIGKPFDREFNRIMLVPTSTKLATKVEPTAPKQMPTVPDFSNKGSVQTGLWIPIESDNTPFPIGFYEEESIEFFATHFYTRPLIIGISSYQQITLNLAMAKELLQEHWHLYTTEEIIRLCCEIWFSLKFASPKTLPRYLARFNTMLRGVSSFHNRQYKKQK